MEGHITAHRRRFLFVATTWLAMIALLWSPAAWADTDTSAHTQTETGHTDTDVSTAPATDASESPTKDPPATQAEGSTDPAESTLVEPTVPKDAATGEVAQDIGEELSLEDLMGVEVGVISNVVREPELWPVSVTVIKAAQLLLSGARTLSEAIGLFVPGYFMVEDQDDTIAGFRGLSPDSNANVLLLVGGHNLNTEFFWGPPDAILNSSNFDWIERVEVIRGPGSVTLGQGALLGVINIIPKRGLDLEEQELLNSVSTSVGMGSLLQASIDSRARIGKLTSYLYLSGLTYDGEPLPDDGWARYRQNEGHEGGSVFDMGHHVMRSDNVTVLANTEYAGFGLTALYADQSRDLYNFYRDRDRFRQRLMSLGLSQKLQLHERVGLELSGLLSRDDFALSSVKGLESGGTRENRFGAKAILRFLELFPGNRMAIGGEAHGFYFGRKNYQGHNFIVNSHDEETLSALPRANEERTFAFREDVYVFSAFVEDFHTFNHTLTLFGAARFDHHPNWGAHLSPRIGAITNPSPALSIRFSYQSGFRGAPGVFYGGGYKGDGLLREESFDDIAKATEERPDGAFANLPKTKPQRMHSFELAGAYQLHPFVRAEAVGFFNIIQNVIDVGVLWDDANVYPMPPIGDDVPGDWNGYWTYKNIPGSIKQWGLEPSVSFENRLVSARLSHALVLIADADKSQASSMYITRELDSAEARTGRYHCKAYPENATRLNLLVRPLDGLSVALNYLYSYHWYSPSSEYIDSNHILSGGVSYAWNFGLTVSIIAKNLLNQRRPYPMNNNAGNEPVLSSGTPTLEAPSVWVKARYEF
jgi:outer membrane receptor protein involved in Fe transport